jgi:hypothetical protein
MTAEECRNSADRRGHLRTSDPWPPLGVVRRVPGDHSTVNGVDMAVEMATTRLGRVVGWGAGAVVTVAVARRRRRARGTVTAAGRTT